MESTESNSLECLFDDSDGSLRTEESSVKRFSLLWNSPALVSASFNYYTVQACFEGGTSSCSYTKQRRITIKCLVKNNFSFIDNQCSCKLQAYY